MPDRIEIEGDERLPGSQEGTGKPWGRRILTLLVAIAAVSGFALIVVYSYDRGGDQQAGGEAPVIAAHTGPSKVRPDSPGGMQVPDQDKQVYGQIDTARMPEQVERLLPPPEPIVTRPPPAMTETAPPPPAPALPVGESAGTREQAAPEPAAGDPGPATAAAARPPAPPPAPEAASPSAIPPPSPSRPESTVAARPPPASSPSLDSSWRIQIASLQSEEAANTAWDRLIKGNEDILGRLRHQVVRVELSGKGTFYRLQAGPLEDASEATALCSRVKERNIGCLVVRP